jgi:hypothetical protein
MQGRRWHDRPDGFRSSVMLLVMAMVLATALPTVASATDIQPSRVLADSERSMSFSAIPAGAITPRQAANHVGRTKTVCGKVASATYARYSNGRPTFLNLGTPYPRQIFTIVIWGEYRSLYPRAPEKMFAGRTVCVRGLISKYAGTPQIAARSNRVWRP